MDHLKKQNNTFYFVFIPEINSLDTTPKTISYLVAYTHWS